MAFADRLGVFGLALALIAIAAPYLWPDKKWIGWVSFFGAVAVLLIWGWIEVWNKVLAQHATHPIRTGILLFIAGGSIFTALGLLVVNSTDTAETKPASPEAHGESSVRPPTAAEIADEVARRLPRNDEKPSRASLPLVPLIKQRATTANIPFNVDPMNSGVILETNDKDPLMLTYIELSGLVGVGPHISQEKGISPATDDEAIEGIEEALRYYALRCVEDLQRPRTSFSIRDREVTTHQATPVSVPDPEQYPELEKLLKETGFGISLREQHLWKKGLEVPKGTKIVLQKNTVVFEKKDYFKMSYQIEYGSKSIGVFPARFRPMSMPMRPINLENVRLFTFHINMRFEWYRDYGLAQPYSDWAEGLFAGIEKKFRAE